MQTELQIVQSLGVKPDRIIYAQPCKAASHLRHARLSDVLLMTFDNEEELKKVKREFMGAEWVLKWRNKL